MPLFSPLFIARNCLDYRVSSRKTGLFCGNWMCEGNSVDTTTHFMLIIQHYVYCCTILLFCPSQFVIFFFGGSFSSLLSLTRA